MMIKFTENDSSRICIASFCALDLNINVQLRNDAASPPLLRQFLTYK